MAVIWNLPPISNKTLSPGKKDDWPEPGSTGLGVLVCRLN